MDFLGKNSLSYGNSEYNCTRMGGREPLGQVVNSESLKSNMKSTFIISNTFSWSVHILQKATNISKQNNWGKI